MPAICQTKKLFLLHETKQMKKNPGGPKKTGQNPRYSLQFCVMPKVSMFPNLIWNYQISTNYLKYVSEYTTSRKGSLLCTT